MANVNTAFGLQPVQHLNGSPWNGACGTYYVPSTDTNQYNKGDPVYSIAADDGNGIPVVSKVAIPGSAFLGAFMGIAPVTQGSAAPNLDMVGIPAAKTRGYYVLISDAADTVYEVQNGSGTTLTASYIGYNINLKINAAPTQVNALSSVTIDETTVATTTTLNCRLLRLSPRMRQGVNNTYGAYAMWQVYINNHERAAGVTGI